MNGTMTKIIAYGYVGCIVLSLIARPVEKSVNYIVWKAKIAKGLKEGTIVEENGKYYEKFTVEDGPNYRKNRSERVKKHCVIVDI